VGFRRFLLNFVLLVGQAPAFTTLSPEKPNFLLSVTIKDENKSSQDNKQHRK